MRKKDIQIINDNPDKTPYELLELGLSQKAFEELQKGGDNIKVDNELEIKIQDLKVEQSIRPEITQQVIAPAKVESTAASQRPTFTQKPQTRGNSTAGAAILRNKITGKVTRMNATTAANLSRNYPHNFEIIP